MSPADFTEIKKKIEQSTILSENEKKEWLFLLPKMTAEQIKELDRILSIRLPVPKATSQEQKVAQEERKPEAAQPPSKVVSQQNSSYGYTLDVKRQTVPAAAPPSPKPSTPTPPTPQRFARETIKRIMPEPVERVEGQSDAVSKIRNLSIQDLHRAPSVYVFFEELGKKMKELRTQARASIDQIRLAFEQSPLCKTYLEAGLKIIEGGEPATLTRDEFEAIADFRASLRRMLN